MSNESAAQGFGTKAVHAGCGGYILCGSQEFIEDIPTESILAMYDENTKH